MWCSKKHPPSSRVARAQSPVAGAVGALGRAGLDQAAARLKEHLAAADTVDFADAAYTLQTGRRAFSHRRALVCCDRDEALRLLAQPDPKRVFSGKAERQLAGVAFLFPGRALSTSTWDVPSTDPKRAFGTK